MKLPNYAKAQIAKEKITEYLLSLAHSSGHGKAKFFMSFGFTLDNWEVLAQALQQHAETHDITRIEPSPFGTRYIIEGVLQTPDERNPQIRVIWFIATGEELPHLASAYPLKGKKTDDTGT
jgi:hypothetical protein